MLLCAKKSGPRASRCLSFATVVASLNAGVHCDAALELVVAAIVIAGRTHDV